VAEIFEARLEDGLRPTLVAIWDMLRSQVQEQKPSADHGDEDEVPQMEVRSADAISDNMSDHAMDMIFNVYPDTMQITKGLRLFLGSLYPALRAKWITQLSGFSLRCENPQQIQHAIKLIRPTAVQEEMLPVPRIVLELALHDSDSLVTAEALNQLAVLAEHSEWWIISYIILSLS